ncbi:MAG: hypothetical protein QM757_44350 [Paludibaculum sp.]
MAGNVYWGGARPYAREASPVVDAAIQQRPSIVEEGGHGYLILHVGASLTTAVTRPVTTALLGKARIPNLGFENADGSALSINTDFAGKARDGKTPTPGPFELTGQGERKIPLW